MAVKASSDLRKPGDENNVRSTEAKVVAAAAYHFSAFSLGQRMSWHPIFYFLLLLHNFSLTGMVADARC